MATTILETMGRGIRAAAGIQNGKTVGKRMYPIDGYTSRSLDLVGNRSATYEELYRTQVWVQVVVNRLARSIARLPLKVYINPDEPSERERVRDGFLADLLSHPGGRGPNRLRMLGPGRLKQEIVANVAIHGNCVLVKGRAQPGAPVSWLVPSSFAYWDIATDTAGNIWYWYCPSDSTRIPFRPEEVVHFMWWAGGRGLKAASPLESLRTTLAAEDATQRHIIASFENGARPIGAFSIDGQVNDPVVIERLQAQLQKNYAGVDNHFKIMLLEGGTKWMPMQHTLVENDALNLRKLTREEVAAAYNLPPPVIGILERATFSNITEQHLMEYQDTVQPWTSMIEETLATQLIEDEPLMQGQYAEFDFGAVLAGDPVKQTNVLTRAVGGPFMTPNEARGKMNLPPIDDEQADSLRPPANASLKDYSPADPPPSEE